MEQLGGSTTIYWKITVNVLIVGGKERIKEEIELK